MCPTAIATYITGVSIRFRIRSEFSPLSNGKGICLCAPLSIYLCFRRWCDEEFFYELFSVNWILRSSIINIVFITTAELW